jgi:hypothetical protein
MADIKKLGFSYEIHTDGTKDPISSSCTYCTHVAKRLQAKVDSLKAAYRHVPKKLLRDLEIANVTKDDHTTRDKENMAIHDLVALIVHTVANMDILQTNVPNNSQMIVLEDGQLFLRELHLRLWQNFLQLSPNWQW